MNNPRLWLLSPLLFALLAACASGPGAPGPGGPTPAPPRTVTAADAWGGPPPEGAAIVTPEAFERDLQAGGLEIASPRTTQAQRDAALAQYGRDRATLAAIPTDERSPDVQDLLDRAAGGGDPLAQPGLDVRQADGSVQKVALLSLADQARHAVEGLARAASPDNALDAYAGTYEAAPDAARAGLPSPDGLRGRPLAEIEAAQLRLDDALETAPDPVRAESTLGAQVVTPGAGSDGAACTPGANGIHNNFWWPLKRFVTPIRNQGMRGTCWAFASVAALESRELVVNGATFNLSEQAFVNRDKFEFARDDWNDGGSAEAALGRFAEKNALVPPETAWTYNAAPNRAANAFDEGVVGTAASYTGACTGYGGTCSEAAHQTPRVCASFFFGTVCGFVKANANTAGGVASNATTTLWHNQHANRRARTRRAHFPLGTLRAHLNSGRTLIGSFGVFRGFDAASGAASGGFVTDYARANGRGGHVVLIVGFVSNTKLASRLPSAPQGAGGGYFVVKNSWGCAADGGFYYVPVDYVTKFFTDLSVLKMPSQRSQKWRDEVQGGGQGPAVRITRPFASSGGPFAPINYIDFKTPITFEATASDTLDGPNCCADSFRWTSRRRGEIGTGRSVTVNLADFADDTVTVVARDRDGNTGQAVLSLSDAYPTVTITAPVPGQTVETNRALAFAAKVEAFRGADPPAALDCAALTWTSNVAADGTGSGCTPSFTFRTTGPRTLTARYAPNGRNATATVSVNVVAPAPSGPPVVALNVLGYTSQPTGGNPRYILRVRFGFTDPGGPGETDRSRYTYRWTYAFSGGTPQAVTPGATNVPGEVLIDVGQIRCGSVRINLALAVTDPENLTGTGTTSYTLQLPSCVN